MKSSRGHLGYSGAGTRTRIAAVVLTAAAALGLGSVAAPGAAPMAAATAAPTAAAAVSPGAQPSVSITTVMSGLSIPWDVAFLPNRDMLVTIRSGQLLVHTSAGATRTVSADFSDVFAQVESGVMGVLADRNYSSNHIFYTCQSYQSGGKAVDIRVIRWRMNSGETAATRYGNPVVSGLPITSGRHAGCRLRYDAGGYLNVGTGDAATGVNPQDLQSLGGKTLRVNTNGSIPTDNPFYSKGGNARYVWTYGHRNVQGLTLRPGTSQLWNAEQGTGVDDEVNVIHRGGNYGYDPIPGYNESVPMTDTTKYPDAIRASWSSGNPTISVSGAMFLSGDRWGRWEGNLAIAVLKDTEIRMLTFTPDGTLAKDEQLAALGTSQGRIRTVQMGPDGALYVTTSNGSNDKVLRIAPTSALPTVSANDHAGSGGVGVATHGNATTVFVRGASGNVFASEQLVPGATFSAFREIPGGTVTSAPAAVWDGSRYRVFARGPQGQLLASYSSGGSFVPWQNLGGYISTQPAVASDQHGRLWLTARGAGTTGYLRIYSGGWQPWTSLGGSLGAAPSIGYAPNTNSLHVDAPNTHGVSQELAVSATGAHGTWRSQERYTWRNTGISSGSSPVRVTSAPDGTPVAIVGMSAIGLQQPFTGPAAVAVRQSGSGYVIAGRGTDGALAVYDGRAGHYTFTRVGGSLR